MAEDSQLELEGITAAGQSTSLDGRIQRELVRVALFGDDEVGPRVGRFAIEERLGAGASAVVYAASDPELGRRVAIKILSRRDDTGRWAAHMRREAWALARLSHRNVVAVYEVGDWSGYPFIAMELIDGTTLARWQAAAVRTPRELLSVYVAAGRGLEAAHDVGLVHRDFKPANVLVASDGRVVVGDFGLVGDADTEDGAAEATADGNPARRTPRATLPAIGPAGVPMGTPAYRAPEQAHGALPHARADVYSFCVALVEALLGRHPLLEAGPSWPSELARRVPRRTRAALCRGMAIDPLLRWSSMTPLLEILERDLARPPHRTRTVAARLVLAIAAGAVAASSLDDPSPAACSDVGAAVAEAMVQLDRNPTATAAALRAIPVSCRSDPWAVAARSTAIKPIAEEVSCRWPSPPRSYELSGDLAVVQGADGRITACDIAAGAISVVVPGRCVRTIDATSLAVVSDDRSIELHERSEHGWRRTARLAGTVVAADPAEAQLVATCGFVPARPAPGHLVVRTYSGRRWSSETGALFAPPSRAVLEHGSRTLVHTPDLELVVIDRGGGATHRRSVARGVLLFYADPALHVAIATLEDRIDVLDLDAGSTLASMPREGRTPDRFAYAVSRDGRTAVIVIRDGALLWWHRGTSGWQPGRAATRWTFGAALSPSGDRALFRHTYGDLEVHDRVTGEVHELATGGAVEQFGFVDDDTVVALHRGGRIQRWRLSAQRSHVVTVHDGWVWTVATGGEATVASGGQDGIVRIADLAGGPMHRLEIGRDVRTYSLALDGERLLAGSGDGTLQIWSWRDGRQLRTLAGHEGWVFDFEVVHSGDEEVIATGSKSGAIRLWSTAATEPMLLVPGDVRVHDIDATRDGRRLGVVRGNGQLILIDVRGRSVIATINAHAGGSDRLAIDERRRAAVTIGYDGWIRSWSIDDGQLQWEVSAHAAKVTDIEIEDDVAVTGAEDGTARLWDLSDGRLLRTFTGHRTPVLAVRFRGDGRWLATGDEEGRVCLRQLDRTECHTWLLGHREPIMSIRFLRDGRLVTGSYEGTMRVWDPFYDAPVRELGRALAFDAWPWRPPLPVERLRVW